MVDKNGTEIHIGDFVKFWPFMRAKKSTTIGQIEYFERNNNGITIIYNWNGAARVYRYYYEIEKLNDEELFLHKLEI